MKEKKMLKKKQTEGRPLVNSILNVLAIIPMIICLLPILWNDVIRNLIVRTAKHSFMGHKFRTNSN